MAIQVPKSPTRRGPLALLLAGTVVLIATIIGTNFLFLVNFRESSLQNAEADLARHTLTLGEQTDRSFKALDLVLSSVGDYMRARE